MLVTNRIGRDARLLPARAFPRDTFGDVLAALPLESIKVRPWQVEYDLAWAVKTGSPRGGGIRPLPEFLRCPVCAHRMEWQDRSLKCAACEHTYSAGEDGVLELARPQR